MSETRVTKADIQKIIDQEWKDCETQLSTFAAFKGISLKTLKEHKFLIKPSAELVVWNCDGLWKDEIEDTDEESILKILSVKIAGRVMGKIYKDLV
jgi:hypothetical protein